MSDFGFKGKCKGKGKGKEKNDPLELQDAPLGSASGDSTGLVEAKQEPGSPPAPAPPGGSKKDLPALRIKYREQVSTKVATAKLEAINALD
eukprot:11032939-Alexandrium_andersonii.AAC.1